MKRITSTDIQRNFKGLIPIPESGYEVRRDGVVIAYMFPADTGINVSYGIEVEVRENSPYLGRCHKCGIMGRLTKVDDGWICTMCEDGEPEKRYKRVYSGVF